MEANKYDEARKTLQPLLAAEPGNAWYLDLATDIDLGQNKANEAINRLKNARDLRTNPVLQLNPQTLICKAVNHKKRPIFSIATPLIIKMTATAGIYWHRRKPR